MLIRITSALGNTRYLSTLVPPVIPPTPGSLKVKHGSTSYTSTPASFNGAAGSSSLILSSSLSSVVLQVTSIVCDGGISTSTTAPFNIPVNGTVTVPITIAAPGKITFTTNGVISSFEVDIVGLGCLDSTLWLESDYGVLSQLSPPIVANPGDAVAAWLDRSTQANNMIGTTGKPGLDVSVFGSKNGLTFDGTKFLFNEPYPYAQITAFFVVYPTTQGVTPNALIFFGQFSGDAANTSYLLFADHSSPTPDARLRWHYQDNANVVGHVYQSGDQVLAPQLLTGRFDSAPVLRVDGAPGTSGSSTGTLHSSGYKLGIGAPVDSSGNPLDPLIYGLWLQGKVGALIIVPRAMTDNEIAYVEAELISKYSL